MGLAARRDVFGLEADHPATSLFVVSTARRKRLLANNKPAPGVGGSGGARGRMSVCDAARATPRTPGCAKRRGGLGIGPLRHGGSAGRRICVRWSARSFTRPPPRRRRASRCTPAPLPRVWGRAGLSAPGKTRRARVLQCLPHTWALACPNKVAVQPAHGAGVCRPVRADYPPGGKRVVACLCAQAAACARA